MARNPPLCSACTSCSPALTRSPAKIHQIDLAGGGHNPTGHGAGAQILAGRGQLGCAKNRDAVRPCLGGELLGQAYTVGITAVDHERGPHPEGMLGKTGGPNALFGVANRSAKVGAGGPVCRRGRLIAAQITGFGQADERVVGTDLQEPGLIVHGHGGFRRARVIGTHFTDQPGVGNEDVGVGDVALRVVVTIGAVRQIAQPEGHARRQLQACCALNGDGCRVHVIGGNARRDGDPDGQHAALGRGRIGSMSEKRR